MLGGLDGFAVVVVALGVASVLAGGLLALRGARNAATVFVSSWFVLFGITQVMAAYDVPRDARSWSLMTNLLYGAIIGLGVAYPSAALSTRKRWQVSWVVLAAVWIGFVERGNLSTDLGPSSVLAEMFEALATLGVPALLAWRWVRERGDAARAQISWVLVPLSFWVVHDGLPAITRYLGRHGISDGAPIGVRVSVGWEALGVAAVAAFALWCLARSLRGDPGRRLGARRLGLALLAFFPLSIPQFMVPAAAGLATHFFFDGLALFVLFYGIARYKVLDIDLKIRWGVARGTTAAFFLAAFFLASEAAQQFLGESTGSTYWGIAGASLLVFAISPLQRLAERVSVRAVPMHGGPDAYLAYRRLQIYRAALEGALKDGTVQPWEQDSLRALRRELAVTDQEHGFIERDIRSAVATPVPAAALD